MVLNQVAAACAPGLAVRVAQAPIGGQSDHSGADGEGGRWPRRTSPPCSPSAPRCSSRSATSSTSAPPTTSPTNRSAIVALFIRLLKDRQWWLGSLVAGGRVRLQAAALGFGSVLLVQALLVTSLLFALPISARCRRPPGHPLAVDVGGAAGRGGRGDRHRRQPDRRAVPRRPGGVDLGDRRPGPGAGAVPVGADRRRAGAAPGMAPAAAAVLLGLVSGSLWGLFAVLTKGVVDRLGDGLWALLKTPELYAVGGGRRGGHGLAAVVVPGRFAGGVAADDDGQPNRWSARCSASCVLGETLRPGEAGWFVLIAGGGGDGGRDGGAGPR